VSKLLATGEAVCNPNQNATAATEAIAVTNKLAVAIRLVRADRVLLRVSQLTGSTGFNGDSVADELNCKKPGKSEF
jgi:hypothetical protein